MKLVSRLFLLCLFCSLSLNAADPRDLIWTTTDGEVTITDCDEAAAGELVIPDTIGGNPVTSIGRNAFYECTSLTSITIPDSVTSIGSGAFIGCTALAMIEVGVGNVNYTEVNGVLFNTEMTLLHSYPAGKPVTNYVIPNSVTSIGLEAFRDCSSLTNITLGEGVTTIGPQAFSDCSSLTSITIPDGVTTIGPQAFSDCSSLTSITIPDSVTLIYSRTFVNCSSLTSVAIGNGIFRIPGRCFENCSSLASIIIPGNVTEFSNFVFRDCTSLTSITFLGAAPAPGIAFGIFFNVAEGATAYVYEEFADSFGGSGSTWEGLAVVIQMLPTITACGFMNATTFFIEFEPAGTGYRVMSSPTLDFGNAVEVTPTLEPTSGDDNRFEFAVSGARNFYRLEPTE